MTNAPRNPDETQPEGAPEPQVGLQIDVVNAVEDALQAGEIDAAAAVVHGLHAADVADLIETIDPVHRPALIDAIQESFDPEVLTELNDNILEDVVDRLGSESTAAAVAELETDEALEVLDDLDAKLQKEVLDQLDESDRSEIEQALAFPEQSAGRLMQRDLIAVPSYWNVGQVIDYLRETEDLPDEFYELILIDADHHPIGTLPLNVLLRSRRPVRIDDIMNVDLRVVPVEMDQEEVAYAFQQYDMASVPVVDPSGRLVGVIMHDDIADVIQEEAEEDIRRLTRAGGAGIHDGIFDIVRGRSVWLLVNLLTAVVASLVISMFGGTIEQIVALAILMPIVASMGGNAGTQALTVTVRALAMRDITGSNVFRLINKELIVSFINGVVFAVLCGIGVYFWFGDLGLALIILAAMIINMMAAGFSGILIPLGLNRVGVDPALAATVFVTTVTDVVGFFAFLGLAAWLLP
ncbi:MAG: magnesium transporter [Alphaproteobacteria bacterium]|nr:magnesium transporter [Alphaproteobacteria bacterium]